MSTFSFDEWVALYESNPDEFERIRSAVLEQEILKAPIHRRGKLRILQMECDAIHQTFSPTEALSEMTKMMSSKLTELSTNLTHLREICEDLGNS